MKRLLLLFVVCLGAVPTSVFGQGQGGVNPQVLSGRRAGDPADVAKGLGLTAAQKAKLIAEFPTLFKVLEDTTPELPGVITSGCTRLVQGPPDRITEELTALTPTLTAIAEVQAGLKAYATHQGLTLPDFPSAEAAGPRAEWLTGVCAQLLADELESPVDPAALAKKDREPAKAQNIAMHRRLVSTQLSLSRLRKWQRGLMPGAPSTRGASAVALHAALTAAEEVLQDTLDAHGLDRAFSASVFTGVAMANNGLGLGSAASSKIPESDTTIPISMLTVESKHWGWEGERWWDMAVRTTLGFRPVTTIVMARPAPPESDGNESTVADPNAEPVDPQPTVIQQNALTFGAGTRFGFFSQRNFELSVVGMAHVSRLTTDEVLLNPNNKKAFLTTPTEASSRTRWGAETGLEMKFYDSAIRLLHAEGGMSSPALSLAAGMRWDPRFRASGALADVDLGDHPDRRLYARVFLDAFKVFNPRTLGEAPGALDIGFGIEYDRALPGGRHVIPSVTRFIIRGNLNLIGGK